MSAARMDTPEHAPGDGRSRTSALIREREDALAADVFDAVSRVTGALDAQQWRAFAELMLRMCAASVDAGSLDAQSAAMPYLARYSPPLTTRQLLDAVHHPSVRSSTKSHSTSPRRHLRALGRRR